MNKAFLKLLISCTNEEGETDLAKLKSSYRGAKDIQTELRALARSGYISVLDAEDGIEEFMINDCAYRLFKE